MASGGIAPMIGAAIMAAVVAADGGSSVPRAGVGAWVWFAGYLAVLSVITVATTFVTPDPADRDLGDPRDAVTTSREEDGLG